MEGNPALVRNTNPVTLYKPFSRCVLCCFVVFVGYRELAALTIVTETAGYVCARSARGFGTGLEKPEFLLAFGAERMETLKTLQSQIMEPI